MLKGRPTKLGMVKKSKSPLAKPKVSSNTLKVKARTPLQGAGPLLPGQSRAKNSYFGDKPTPKPLRGEGPLLPGQSRVDVRNEASKKSSKKSSKNKNRSLAQKAFNKVFGVNTAEAYDEEKPSITELATPDVDKNGEELVPIKSRQGVVSDLIGGLTKGAKRIVPGVGLIAKGLEAADIDLTRGLGVNRLLMKNTGLSMPKSVAEGRGPEMQLNRPYTADMPTGYGDQGEIFYNNNTKPTVLRSDVAKPGTNFSRPGSEAAYLRGESPLVPNGGRFGTPMPGIKPSITSLARQPQVLGAQDEQVMQGPITKDEYIADKRNQINEIGTAENLINDMRGTAGQLRDLEARLYGQDPEEIRRLAGGATDNELSNIINAQEQFAGVQPTYATVSKKFGRGDFGNGKYTGSQGDLTKEERDYIKSLRESAAGDYGAAQAQSQYDALINALTPMYDLEQKAAQEQLDFAKNEDINKLRAMFASQNTAGSEQQEQYVQRTQGDYAKQLANLLANLSTKKTGQVADYQSQLANRLGQIEETKRAQQQKVADLIRSVQQDAYNRRQGSLQQSFENRMALARFNADQERASRDTGFTMNQQQNLLESFQNDLQKALERYARLGYGRNGREMVANELVKKYGGVFDPQSISDDVMTAAYDGWEGDYQKLGNYKG